MIPFNRKLSFKQQNSQKANPMWYVPRFEVYLRKERDPERENEETSAVKKVVLLWLA